MHFYDQAKIFIFNFCIVAFNRVAFKLTDQFMTYSQLCLLLLVKNKDFYFQLLYIIMQYLFICIMNKYMNDIDC